MGTTLVVAIVVGNTLYFANVGDRLYLINDKIRQISRIIPGREMVRLGGIKAEEPRITRIRIL